MSVTYPDSSRDRDRWILSRRPARHQVDPLRPYSVVIEQERAADGELVPVLTVFLTNRECPWRCLMCDLWKNTLPDATPFNAIPTQLDWALKEAVIQSSSLLGARPLRQIKLYNSGSFFDPRAIPPEEYGAIAERLRGFERVIVECHPSLVGGAMLRFRDLLSGELEVAMGLETAHPDVLDRLNKRMTLPQFASAARFLQENGINLRVFVLIKPPFLNDAEALHWTLRSVQFAVQSGASVISLIPTRAGNGAMEALAEQGLFSPPSLNFIEEVARQSLSMGGARMFIDLWDLATFADCDPCFSARRAALEQLNLTQRIQPRVECSRCKPRLDLNSPH